MIYSWICLNDSSLFLHVYDYALQLDSSFIGFFFPLRRGGILESMVVLQMCRCKTGVRCFEQICLAKVQSTHLCDDTGTDTLNCQHHWSSRHCKYFVHFFERADLWSPLWFCIFSFNSVCKQNRNMYMAECNSCQWPFTPRIQILKTNMKLHFELKGYFHFNILIVLQDLNLY